MNIWNPVLAALVHYSAGNVLQCALSDGDLGEVALTRRFACDSLGAELHGMQALKDSHGMS